MTLTSKLNIRKAIPLGTTKGSVETRYKMVRLFKETETDNDFYMEQYKALLEDCAARNEDGTIKEADGKLCLSPDKFEAFSSKMGSLCRMRVEDPTVSFSLAELEPFDLSVEALLALDPIIK